MGDTCPGPLLKSDRPSPPTGAFHLRLLTDIGRQLPGKTEDIAHHMVGDHIENNPHLLVSTAGCVVSSERRNAPDGRGRLNPLQPAGTT